MSDRVPLPLRALVRRRASRRCEYCLLHDSDATVPHEPDHIIARKHRGATVAENLAWACAACNGQKGTDIASIDPDTGHLVRLFDPRKDDWSAHFRLEGAAIVPCSAIGRVTEYLLQLNRFDRLANRGWLLRAGRYPR
jgi:5-methylcytosine-specific restriction endonuclease McrA